ncbi:phage tail tape measure protein [Pararhodobacter sp.]|uniref:phage tail tape measure protein n=1 Tax=Pararhodobacter sp. TaxID=2127056 RepID=UPI002AFE89B3|nr:phage tail tape measure protein [Pararhodobacter sp.]
MAGRTMDLSILVRLVDRITGPLGALQRRFAQFAALGQRIGILGAAAAAISFAAPIASAAAFDQALRDIVVTADYGGTAAERRIRELASSVSKLALEVGIASNDLLKAQGLLIAAGAEETLVDKLMPTIGRVAKASSAVPEDVAKVTFALSNSLKISAGEMEIALAKLVTAGKLGRFEFRDMAKELPELASQFAKFRVTGLEAVETIGASLQVAMFGTDNTSAAANNFKNFLSKLLSPEVVKNFEKKAGVDILGVMQDASAKGLNPIESAIQKIMQVTGVSTEKAMDIFRARKGEGMTDAEAAAAAVEQIKAIAGSGKLSQIFGDMQVLDFLLPMLANIEKYKEFKQAISEAGLDVIAKDFATQFEGLQTQLAITEEIGTQMANRIGIAFGQNLPWINAFGTTLLQWVHQLDQDFPGMVDTIVSGFGAFLALVAGLALTGPVFTVLSAAFGALAAVIALVLSPLGLLLAALAAIAYLIYQDWEGFAPFFSELWEGVKTSFSGLIEFFQALFAGDWAGMEAGLAKAQAGLSRAGQALVRIAARLLPMIGNALRAGGAALLGWLDNLFGGWPSKIAGVVRGIGIAIGSAFGVIGGQVYAWGKGLLDRILGAFGTNPAALTAKGAELINGLWNGAKSVASSVLQWAGNWAGNLINELSSWKDEDWAKIGTDIGNKISNSVKEAINSLVDWFAGLPGRILGAIGSIDLSGIIKMPSLPAWMGGSPAAPAAANENTPGASAPAAPVSGPASAPAPQKQGFAPVAGPKFASAAAVSGKTDIGGRIIVAAAPGSEVRQVETTNKAVPLQKADNGRVVGRV